jgi:hypothetical protein
VLLAIALSALIALNVFVFWLERWSGVDADALVAAHPAMRDVFRYFGFEFVSNSLAFGAILVVCALALTRDRSNMFAWLFGGSVVLWMLSNASFGATALALDAEPALRSAPVLAWLGVATITLFPMGLNVAVALFPNGRLAATGPWRWMLRVALFVPIAIVSLRLLQPGPMSLDYNDPPFALDNPFGLGVFSGFGPAWSQFATAVSGVAVLASVATTYVRAGSDVRHQLKWVIGVVPYVAVSAVLISAVNTPWAGLPVAVGMLLFATALGFAVTKYRLYDIDVVISRTFVYVLAGRVHRRGVHRCRRRCRVAARVDGGAQSGVGRRSDLARCGGVSTGAATVGAGGEPPGVRPESDTVRSAVGLLATGRCDQRQSPHRRSPVAGGRDPSRAGGGVGHRERRDGGSSRLAGRAG